jgi:hypothetical protein
MGCTVAASTPIANNNGRARMPKVVEPDASHTSSSAQRLERSVDVPRLEGCPVLRREHQTEGVGPCDLCVAELIKPMPPQDRNELRRQGHRGGPTPAAKTGPKPAPLRVSRATTTTTCMPANSKRPSCSPRTQTMCATVGTRPTTAHPIVATCPLSASTPTPTPASLANHPRRQKNKDWVPLTTSPPQPPRGDQLTIDLAPLVRQIAKAPRERVELA